MDNARWRTIVVYSMGAKTRTSTRDDYAAYKIIRMDSVKGTSTINAMIIEMSQLCQCRPTYGRVVATNGCFDIIHTGHNRLLQAAKAYGSVLVVGVNDDAGVKALKGEHRPVNTEQDRMEVLAAFRNVDYVCLFHGTTATEFLKAVKPDIYVKGGDYTLATLNPDERKVLEDCGAKIVFVPLTPGKSTTGILERMR